MNRFSFEIHRCRSACAVGFIFLALACVVPVPAAADDTPAVPKPAAAANADPLAAARTHIAAKRWPAALDELKRLNARKDADWNNLMGYALRKQASPDLAAAEKYYNEALRLNPAHLGALEYSGELYLMKGDLAKAEQRLATLAKACSSCEQLQDLQEATARFKAAGNRYVPH